MALLVVLVCLQLQPVMAKDADSAEQQRKKKAAAKRRRQRKDARIVKKILHAATRQDHYGVLGLRNWEVQIPAYTVKLLRLNKSITTPEWKLFHISSDQIKRAYRNRAIAVHPDKNSDPHASEAFIAVENAASLLTNESQRKTYDDERRLALQERRQHYTQRGTEALQVVVGALQKALWTAKSILGPFAFPVLILGALII
ncbi:ATP binding to DnaK triggers the release of the substrate protein [Seminavis robusta]|uniref:ATP binding to DnaK triggers the release of the substrate protein n=1 Tax=Seminavis robusta TaxID=568900 RepID=A0A9N8DRD0_9STRA|nr:ATP binding to DnaK triggers the release of the substrate protein [Seminavis robusta]|eukprot:Sro228_g092530.1 ATP binding to DnaK triggers the release of the substrate protein (200) ;mRNA; f:10455-11054